MTGQELELLFKKMLKEQEEIIKQDEIYLEDFKNFSLKLNWEFLDLRGYQIFEKDNYSSKFGEVLDEPDVTLIFSDLVPARKFLKGETLYFGRTREKTYKGTRNYDYYEVADIVTDEGKKKKSVTSREHFLTTRFGEGKSYHPLFLQKLPMFRKLSGEDYKKNREKFYGSYIPINKTLGTYENQVVPYKVFKHFIDKADGIVVEDVCGCRHVKKCEHHDHSIGCMHIGSETANIDLEDLEWGMREAVPGRFTTKEEALERVKLAIEDGLIPLLGKINPTGKLMSMCFCCSCCCVNARNITHGPAVPRMFRRIEGLTVEVDPEVCIGCGDCLEVCVFKGMEMIEDKAIVNQKRCLGCGRCEMTCPNGAISIKYDPSTRVKGLVDTLETFVDVT